MAEDTERSRNREKKNPLKRYILRIKGMNLRKKILAVALLVIIAASSGILMVSAYLTSTDFLDNFTTVGYNEIEIVEGFENPDIEVGATTVITKQVQVRNTGESSCKVRVKIAFSDESVLDYTTVDYNTDDWTYDESSGYWEYNKILEIADADSEDASITTSLFTKLTITNPTAEQVKDFKVYVYAESSNT